MLQKVRFGFSALVLTGTLLLHAGCDGPVEPQRQAAALRLSQDSLTLREETTDSLAVTVLDERGEVIRDPKVQWSSSDSSIASINQSGVVTPRRFGRTQIFASVSRLSAPPLTASAAVWVIPALTLRLQPDSLVLTAPGCISGFTGRLYRRSGEEWNGRAFNYFISDSSVASLSRTTGTGTYREQSRNVHALRVGTAEVIASYNGGILYPTGLVIAADTALVRVVTDSIERFLITEREGSSYSPTQRDMAPGDTARFFARAEYPPCQSGVAYTRSVPGVNALFRSLNESVATVSGSGLVTARAVGRVAIVAEWKGSADTVTVDIRQVRITPADTTVFVGDTVVYRAFSTDASGVSSPERIGVISTSNKTIAGIVAGQQNPDAMVIPPGGVAAVIARQPGTAVIGLFVRGQGRSATVKIVSKP